MLTHLTRSVVRTQIQLTEEQAAALKELAAAEGVSMAELVRSAVDRLLDHRISVDPSERRRRALEAAGGFASGRSGVSNDHDEHVARAIEE